MWAARRGAVFVGVFTLAVVVTVLAIVIASGSCVGEGLLVAARADCNHGTLRGTRTKSFQFFSSSAFWGLNWENGRNILYHNVSLLPPAYPAALHCFIPPGVRSSQVSRILLVPKYDI